MTDEEVERPFVRLKIDGDRFKGGRLPVNALDEIQRYQAILIASARREWAESNPGVDVPDGFDDALGLVITAIEDGSAEVVLERPVNSVADSYAERGRDEIEREVAALIAPLWSPVDSPLFELPEFQGIASSVDSGGFFEIISYNADGTDKSSATITATERTDLLVPRQKVVKREISKRRAAEKSKESRSVAGRLFELDAEKRSFQMHTHFGDLTGRYKNDEITDDLRAVLDVSSKAPVIRIQGELQLRLGEAWRITDVTGVELLEIDGQPWSRKLVELAELGPDWDGEVPGAEMISYAALDAARDLMLAFSEQGKPMPSLFPTEEGGVMLEWSSPESVATIEINPDAGFLLYRLPEGSDSGEEVETTDMSEAVGFGSEVAH